MSKEKRNKILKITYSGVCRALAYVFGIPEQRNLEIPHIILPDIIETISVR